MTVISVLYPATGGSRFDLDYYTKKHVPSVRELCKDFGLLDIQILRGVASLDGGGPAVRITGLLTFGSTGEFQNAMARHGAKIMADIPNFTDIQPVLQINEPLAYRGQ
jgi:uncharacterized protein (TIGR02118 family)